MHCHLDFAPNALDATRALDDIGSGAFAVSVAPSDAAVAQTPSREDSLVRWGVGLHPWWVADGRVSDEDVEAVLSAIESSVYVGEVGLDFGKSHGREAESQQRAFEAVAARCAQVGGRVLSIHAVRSAEAVLDVLERQGALSSCACIFHWFSDSSNSLARAVKAGCFFSVGALMMRSRRGREYARQIPSGCLLLETDEPAQCAPYDVVSMQLQLADTLEAVARLRGTDVDELAGRVASTSKDLLSR